MSAPRRRARGPVGLGYLPKGGRAAGVAHNAAVKAQPVAARGDVPATPAADVRADVRASARPDRALVVGLGGLAAGVGLGAAAVELLGLWS